MARAIKFKNNDYLDSTGIVHNKQLLSIILENNIIESKGSGTNGYYIKYKNGLMICYGTVYFNNLVSTTDYWSFSNRTAENLNFSFPQTFIEAPALTMTFQSNVSGCIGLVKNGGTWEGGSGNFGVLVAKGSTGNRNIRIEYIAIGSWK